MVRRDLRWRLWFLLSYTLALIAFCFSVLRGYRGHRNWHRISINISVHHADILRTGGFLDPNEPVRFPGEEVTPHDDHH